LLDPNKPVRWRIESAEPAHDWRAVDRAPDEGFYSV
jgi:hypothetical protein